VRIPGHATIMKRVDALKRGGGGTKGLERKEEMLHAGRKEKSLLNNSRPPLRKIRWVEIAVKRSHKWVPGKSQGIISLAPAEKGKPSQK